MRSGVTKYIAVIFVALVASIFVAPSSYAASYCGTGYFTGNNRCTADPPSMSGNDVIGPRDAVPAYAYDGNNDKQDVFNWVFSHVDLNNTPNTRNEWGGAFIVNTMLGRSTSTRTPIITQAMKDEVYNRLVRNPNIDIYDTSQDPNLYGTVSFYSNNDDFFTSYDSGPRHLLIIRDTVTGVRYVIEIPCANPIGGLSLPQYFWGVNGSSSANVSTAYPGDTITWTHTLRNNASGTNTTATIRYEIRRNGSVVSSDSDVTIASGGSRTYTSTYVVQPGDVGNNICQDIAWRWRSLLDQNWANSADACVNIVEPYELDPYINNRSTDEWKTVGQDVTVQPTVSNSGGSSLSNVHWEITKYYVNPGSYSKGAVVSNSSPATNYAGAGVHDLQAQFQQGDRVFGPGDTNLASLPYSVEGRPYGTRICFALSVRPYRTGSAQWKHGAPYCMLVGKTPSVQVWGNDVRVGSSFLGGTGNNGSVIKGKVLTDGTNYFGTWSEYGLIAPNRITDIASGSGLNSATSPNQSAWSSLTFANATAPNYGSFATASSLGTLPDIIGYLDSDSFSDSINTVTSNAAINQWKPAWGRNVIVDARGGGPLQINGNVIAPSGAFASVGGMPQLIIIANNINIHDSVSRIDAWLIATGTIDTCLQAPPGGPSANQCNENLRINGPVVANRLLLYRTYGSDDTSTLDEPAEVINFSAGSYIWAQHQAKLSSGLRTVSVTELPPRY